MRCLPDSYCRRLSTSHPEFQATATVNRRRSLRSRRAAVVLQNGGVEWEAFEEELLAAVVHEFGTNWQLVADVLAGASALSGFLRTAKACRDRYNELKVRLAGAAFDVFNYRRDRGCSAALLRADDQTPRRALSQLVLGRIKVSM